MLKGTFVATLRDNPSQGNRGKTVAQSDPGGEFCVYMLKPSDKGFKRLQFVRVKCDLRGKTVFRYVYPWPRLDKGKLLIDWQTAVALGLEDDYEEIEQGKVKIEVSPATPFVDQARFVINERHPTVKLAMASGMVGGLVTGVIFFLLDRMF